MLFNTAIFFSFFIITFFGYWFVFKNNIKIQNIFLLIASYFFYAWTSWKFLILIFSVSIFNYFLAIHIEKTEKEKKRKILLSLGITQGVGLLAFYKYYNFFITSINDTYHFFGHSFDLTTLKLIIPLGISFFTFRLISYIYDVEKNKIPVCKDPLVFLNYVSFFPSLLSGPIDKAKLLIPQLEKERTFNYQTGKEAVSHILWGLFKKIIIADNCANYANVVFDNYNIDLSGFQVLVAAFFYTIQIYADFSGYSDMAIGFAKLLGFNITKNFNFPYFAQNIADFWRRWHMSLTAWLTEYVFTPLSISFRDYGKFGLGLAIVINFTICGLWHGASWNYILFGFIHGLYFIPMIYKGTMNKKNKFDKNKILPTPKELLNISKTFILVMITFILFRIENTHELFLFYKKLFSLSLFSVDFHPFTTYGYPYRLLLLCFTFLLFEWYGKHEEYSFATVLKIKYLSVKLIIFYTIILVTLYYSTTEQKFIYFQF
jgi:D-alanyl-lipoteichoic acid acyltransferase DltB (MBOAT superfamily)